MNMMKRSFLIAASVCTLAGSAIAQFDNRAGDEEERPPSPPTAREADSIPWPVKLVVAPLIVATCVAVNLIPSKRGHQD